MKYAAFLIKARAKHGDKYDYPEFDDVLAHSKIEIICKTHGVFMQKLYKHTGGSGCSKCGGRLKLNTTTFIEKANKKHNNIYDYKKVKYIDAKIKVEIICKKHGSFLQTPGGHLFGQGCPKCGGSSKFNHVEFIEKANKIHDKLYSYEKANYLNGKTKVEIICKEHGSFWQAPEKHLKGQGCSECAGLRLSTVGFIEKASKKHNNKYDYSKSVYKTRHSKLLIICKIHGGFLQTPHDHLSGCGCQKCGGNIKLTTVEFIEKANEKHNNKYDYSKSVYKTRHSKLLIICKIHGEFEQDAGNHLSGRGCPGCNSGWTSQTLINFIKSLSSHLDKLSQQELYVLFQQSKILDSNKSDRIMKALKSKNPKTALNKIVKDLSDNPEPTEDKQDNKTPVTKEQIREALSKFLNKNNTDLPKLEPKSILDTMQFSIDKIKSISSSSDEEAIEFLQASAINKLWNVAFDDANKLEKDLG